MYAPSESFVNFKGVVVSPSLNTLNVAPAKPLLGLFASTFVNSIEPVYKFTLLPDILLSVECPIAVFSTVTAVTLAV